MQKDIAVTIQNFVQYQSLEPVFKEFKKCNYNFDIFVPIAKDPWGLDKMFNEIYDYLVSIGYSPKRTVDKTIEYKILLEPYPMDYYFKINHKYRLKYKYGAITSKPNPCLKPDDNIYFDGIFCTSDYEAQYLEAYSNAYVVGNLKFYKYNKIKTNNKKKVLLYLPTYGNLNSISKCASQLAKLKDEYYIITKSHHGTNYFDYEKGNEKQLEDLFDEHYSSKTSIVSLLMKADVVLSDNSGSISEAIYGNVPVAIFADNINPALGNFNSFQYECVEKKIIPYSNNPHDLSKIIKEALSTKIINKQKELSKELFKLKGNDTVKAFMTVISNYLSDNINIKYYQLHHLVIDNFNEKNRLEQEIVKLRNDIDLLKNELAESNLSKSKLQEELHYYEIGKLYKVSKKIYATKNKLRKKEKNE